ncbi:MAG: radical SAM protein [bacterium]|nr:radical SAM protein [bacterium]
MTYPVFDFSYEGDKYFYTKGDHAIHRSLDHKSGGVLEPPGTGTDVAITSIWLNVTSVCNLNCRYCFTPPLNEAAERKESKWMTKEMAQKAIILLAKLRNEHPGNRPANIVFFGGEPLNNFDVIEHAVYFAHEWTRVSNVPFSFAISTNGTLLNRKFLDFFRRERVAVQLSLDGPQVSNDYNRKFRSGSGSYETIMSNVKRLFSVIPPELVNIRSTIAEGTVPLSAMIRFFMEEGFKRLEIKFMSDNRQSGAGVKDAEIEMLEEDVDAAADTISEAMRRGIRIRPFQNHFQSLKDKRCQSFICGAGRGAVSVDTEGWLYPCHRFHENPDYRISHVTEPFDDSISREFARLQSEDIEPCSTCWATKFCWGCCPAESVAFSKSPGYPHPQWCRLKQLEAKISLKAAAAAGLVEES